MDAKQLRAEYAESLFDVLFGGRGESWNLSDVELSGDTLTCHIAEGPSGVSDAVVTLKITKVIPAGTVAAHSLEDYGVDHAQYFRGAGTAYTDWAAVFVGVGDSARDAAEDARENAASAGWLVENIEIPESFSDAADAHADCPDDDDMCELYHYAALFLK